MVAVARGADHRQRRADQNHPQESANSTTLPCYRIELNPPPARAPRQPSDFPSNPHSAINPDQWQLSAESVRLLATMEAWAAQYLSEVHFYFDYWHARFLVA
jgi:hypothetical protein